MALETVANYISEARFLMQDLVVPYRYSDAQIVSALNIAVNEAFRVRPDLYQAYYETVLPSYSAASPLVVVDVDRSYRMAFLYFVVGYCQLSDQEDTTDARSSQFINKFTSQLLQVMA